MGAKVFKISYDKEHDIFSIFEKGKKSKFSFEADLPLGDIIIDFGFDGRIIGLEIFNFSKYHPGLKIGDKSKVKAKMSVQYGQNYAQVNYMIAVPGQKQVEKDIISPYNKELVLAA